jgi:hypothetical protein
MLMTSRLPTVPILGVLSAVLALSACGGGRVADSAYTAPGDRNEFRIHVENDNFYDARIYTIASGGTRRLLGHVTGKTQQVFTVPWTFSNDLSVEISLLAGDTCRTGTIAVDPGDELRLQIMSAAVGGDFCR